ncbi:hypothetical protein TSUD_146330 [Trifolium subterraneum]|uniref:Reverse transcriptase zinc-binding domain-containing protein n=1 Tax=Trifolium subterraneum TaxID=3900 RepID=A0A2Z6MGF4_TRISU|nr:hypothetical protein TSUD_146330 [Trifolium subterraneum]
MEAHFVWKHASYEHLTSSSPILPWSAVIWKKFIPLSHSFIASLLMLNKMSTDENLHTRGCVIWQWVNSIFDIHVDTSSLESLRLSYNLFTSQLKDLLLACLIHSLHSLWMARIEILFNNAKFTFQTSIMKIQTVITPSSPLATDTRLEVAPRTGRPAIIALETWMVSWLKANTDGSAKDNHIVCGAIFRDYNGALWEGLQ